MLGSGLLVLGYAGVWGWPAVVSGFKQFFRLISFIPTMALGVIVHEGLHGLGWKYAGKLRWSDITYGIQWKVLTPYAHSQRPMRKTAFVRGTLLPGIILGGLPYFIALSLGSDWLMLFGFVFTFTASGDFWTVYSLRKVPKDQWVLDHPENVGCIVYEQKPE